MPKVTKNCPEPVQAGVSIRWLKAGCDGGGVIHTRASWAIVFCLSQTARKALVGRHVSEDKLMDYCYCYYLIPRV